ncbi:MAG: vitamin K epoxide reductase family protein [Tepidisphaeraceae bacterium]
MWRSFISRLCFGRGFFDRGPFINMTAHPPSIAWMSRQRDTSTVRATIAGSAALACAAALMLYWRPVEWSDALGYGDGSGCEAVWRTSWSRWADVRISALGAGVYLAMALTWLRTGPAVPSPRRRQAWTTWMALAIVSLGAAAWFMTLQTVAVGRVCGLCVFAQAMGALSGALILWSSPLWHEFTTEGRGASKQRLAWVLGAGGFGLAALVIGQVVLEGDPYRLSSEDRDLRAIAEAESQERARRTVPLLVAPGPNKTPANTNAQSAPGAKAPLVPGTDLMLGPVQHTVEESFNPTLAPATNPLSPVLESPTYQVPVVAPDQPIEPGSLIDPGLAPPKGSPQERERRGR